jgi:hypothetical protein
MQERRRPEMALRSVARGIQEGKTKEEVIRCLERYVVREQS